MSRDMRIKKFKKATVFGVVCLFIYLLFVKIVISSYNLTFFQAITHGEVAGPVLFNLFNSFCFGVSLIYGFPKVRDAFLTAISGCFLHVLLYLWVMAFAVAVGALFGWILYFIDLYHIIKKDDSPNSATANNNYNNYSNNSNYNNYSNNSNMSNSYNVKSDIHEDEESLKDALESINSFKNE